MSIKNDFSTGKVSQHILSIAGPMIVAQLINVLYNVIDRIYIGRIPHVATLAMGGLGLCLPLISIIIGFANLFGMGGAPLCSIARGEGNNKKAEEIMGNSFIMLIICGIVIMIVGFIFKRDLLWMFGASAKTIDYADDYMTVYIFGTLFVMIGLGMNSFINSQGFAKIGMMTVLIGAVVNIILDPIFIFGLHMGVRGAALATILSQAMSCTWVLLFLTGKKTTLRIRTANMKLRPGIILPCLALGVSTFIMQASESVISVCFNSSLQRCGGDIAVGAMTILSSVMQFAMLPLQGLGQGAQPIVSYNYGARNAERVKKAFFLLLRCSLFYSVLLWLSVMLFPELFASLFTNDTALITFTASALRIYLAVLFIFGIQMACQMTFISLGNAVMSALAAIVRKFILLLPLIFLMPRLLPDNKTFAVYLAEPVADTLAVIFTATAFFFTFRKALAELRKMQEQNS